ncbi:hypothetical protein [Paraeggerthella sp.]|uniref:hypothetical protein n=1 Tax=Paraeggerthella sp. TaxID=2897350 RepID=UPI003A8EDFCA
MPSDFGDESGEKFCDWLMDIGQQAGQEAMHAAARKLSVALKHTKGDLGVDEAEPKWARLNLDELSKMESYDSIKQILDKQLEDAGVENSFFTDAKTGQESLLFKHEDASKVDRVFDELIDDVDRSLERADQQLSQGKEPVKTKTKETNRDSEPLEKRSARVQASSAALEAERGQGRGRDIGREDKFQEVKTK